MGQPGRSNSPPGTRRSRRAGGHPRGRAAPGRGDPDRIISFLARRLVSRVLALAPAVFLQLQTIGTSGLLLDAIIALPARSAFEPDVFPHDLAPAPRRGDFRCGDEGGWTRARSVPLQPRRA